MAGFNQSNKIMKGILSLAPAASSFSAIGGARGQFRQISVGVGGAASVASTIPVDHSQIKREMNAFNSLKANGVQSAAASTGPGQQKWSSIIPMKNKEEMREMLRGFNKKRS